MPKHKMRFKTMQQTDVPKGRNGKHKKIITEIVRDLDDLKDGAALSIPLGDLVDGKAKVRSALSRAAKKTGRKVGTSADGNNLYIWNIRD